MVGINLQKQGGCGYCNGQQSQSSSQNNLTLADLWQWLVNHWVARSEKIGSLLNSYLAYISKKVLGQVNESLIGIMKTESHNF